jgi:hypothetical protein
MSEVISVNCECRISKDRQLSSLNQSEADGAAVLVNVRPKDDKGAFQQLFVEYGTFQQCCERIGEKIYKNGADVTDTISFPTDTFVTDIVWDDLDYNERDFVDKYYGYSLCVTLRGKDLYHFVFFNQHNGYYAHTITLEREGKPEVKLLFSEEI